MSERGPVSAGAPRRDRSTMHQLALDFALPSDPAESSPRPRRIAWAKLLARVFAQSITRTCGGRMRVLEVVSDADAIARILHGARAPPAPPPGPLLLLP